MTYETITVEQRAVSPCSPLNRPEKPNAWTPAMMVELRKAMEAAAADPARGPSS
jgi:enoyl-CoA hydratase/carnithine racemase